MRAPEQAPDTAQDDDRPAPRHPNEMPCPVCGYLMPDLKGGKASIGPVSGFKDGWCY